MLWVKRNTVEYERPEVTCFYDGHSMSNEKTHKKWAQIKIVSVIVDIISSDSNTQFSPLFQRFNIFKKEILITLFNPFVAGHNDGFIVLKARPRSDSFKCLNR